MGNTLFDKAFNAFIIALGVIAAVIVGALTVNIFDALREWWTTPKPKTQSTASMTERAMSHLRRGAKNKQGAHAKG